MELIENEINAVKEVFNDLSTFTKITWDYSGNNPIVLYIDTNKNYLKYNLDFPFIVIENGYNEIDDVILIEIGKQPYILPCRNKKLKERDLEEVCIFVSNNYKLLEHIADKKIHYSEDITFEQNLINNYLICPCESGIYSYMYIDTHERVLKVKLRDSLFNDLNTWSSVKLLENREYYKKNLPAHICDVVYRFILYNKEYIFKLYNNEINFISFLSNIIKIHEGTKIPLKYITNTEYQYKNEIVFPFCIFRYNDLTYNIINTITNEIVFNENFYSYVDYQLTNNTIRFIVEKENIIKNEIKYNHNF